MLVRLGYSRERWELGHKAPIIWDTFKANSMLIAGQTGGGKSVFIQYLLYQFLSSCADVKIFDFKAGGEYDGILPPECYAEYLDCDALLESIYQEFLETIHQKKKRAKECFIIIDEFAAWSLQKDSKEQKAFLAKINHIAILGRSMGFRLIIAMQQANSQVIDTSIREQCPVKISMARTITSESAKMLFPCPIEIEQPFPEYCGLYYSPEYGLNLLQVPYIDTEKMKKLLIEKGKKYF